MAVPFVHIVWVYVAVTRVSKSFQRHFAAGGKHSQGDCGYALGLAMVVAVWVMATTPMFAFLFNFQDQVDIAVVGCGLTVFALFGAYVMRMFTAARAIG